MKEDANKKLYEIAYFISPDLGDEEAIAYTATIRNAITKANGDVQKEEMVQKRRLAHSINHKKQGYFGYMHFVMGSDAVQPMSKALALDKTILRHLIIAVDAKQITQMRKPAQNIMAQEKTIKDAADKEAVEKAIFKEGAVSAQEEKKVEIEELDKKLEEILNK